MHALRPYNNSCSGSRPHYVATMSVKRKVYLGLVVSAVTTVCVVSYLSGFLPSGAMTSRTASFSEESVHSMECQCHRCGASSSVRKSAGQMAEDGADMVFDRLLPGEETSREIPGLVPSVVHYLWCGSKKFRFKDYLSVLSAIKIFRPLTLRIHVSFLPQTDDYNTWFKDIQSTIPRLEMQNLSSKASCGSPEMLQTVLGFLSKDGGVFVGEGIILSPYMKNRPVNSDLWFAFANTSDKTSGVIIAKKGFSQKQKDSYHEKILARSTTQPGCTSMDRFTPSAHENCVAVPGILYPRDIIDTNTSFAEVARLLFYGSREPIKPQQDASNPIPRISHFIRFSSGDGKYRPEFPFYQYLNILSALYVAGFHHVYLHTDGELTGRWWQELAKENVTVVRMERPRRVFQHSVGVLAHAGDIARYLVLYKYGGAYQDCDVTWTSYVPDSLLSYPFVASMEWTWNDREWPECFNLGVALAKPQARWLHHHLQTHKDFRDDDWGYNSLRMSYRTYELHPHLMYLDRRLMVICFEGICHPAWEKSYGPKHINDRTPTIPFRWQEDVRALHITFPKPPLSMSSPTKAKLGKDMYGEIARFVLEKSGRHDLLS